MFALIRHAGYHLGDGSLTPDGARDTDALAEALRAAGTWSEIRSSPSARTQETAGILGEAIGIPVIIDERIGMDGDLSDLLPPAIGEARQGRLTEPQGIIFISHLPTLSRWLRAWSKSFGQDEPPLTEIACGYVVDPEAKAIIPVGPLQKFKT